jgi:hypothetical protein
LRFHSWIWGLSARPDAPLPIAYMRFSAWWGCLLGSCAAMAWKSCAQLGEQTCVGVGTWFKHPPAV